MGSFTSISKSCLGTRREWKSESSFVLRVSPLSFPLLPPRPLSTVRSGLTGSSVIGDLRLPSPLRIGTVYPHSPPQVLLWKPLSVSFQSILYYTGVHSTLRNRIYTRLTAGFVVRVPLRPRQTKSSRKRPTGGYVCADLPRVEVGRDSKTPVSEFPSPFPPMSLGPGTCEWGK